MAETGPHVMYTPCVFAEACDTTSYSCHPQGLQGFLPSSTCCCCPQDGGGVTADGVLPEAMALLVHSDRDLAKEFEHIHAVLAAGSGDWDKRIAAMVRLEGLVKGGAAAFDQFGELLRPLVDLLAQQLGDRRSAVTRQAAHLVGQLAMAMGAAFEPYTATFLAVLFKVLVITVQVGVEAGVAGTCMLAWAALALLP